MPVDFSLESMKTLSYASKLADSVGASLCLLHVLGEPRLLSRFRSNPWAVSKQELVDSARVKLAAVMKRKVHPRVAATLTARIGNLDAEILSAAGRHGADLVILHTESKTGMKGVLNNGIIRRLVYEAPCPVLLIPKQVLWRSETAPALADPQDWRRILVPVQMNEVGKQALMEGLALADSFSASVTAFNATRPGRLSSQQRPALLRNQQFVRAKDRFICWVRRNSPAVDAVEPCVGVGKPAAAFLRAARVLGAHLIVMGTQQFCGWRRLRASCAVNRILSETPCPILSVPRPPARR